MIQQIKGLRFSQVWFWFHTVLNIPETALLFYYMLDFNSYFRFPVMPKCGPLV